MNEAQLIPNISVGQAAHFKMRRRPSIPHRKGESWQQQKKLKIVKVVKMLLWEIDWNNLFERFIGTTSDSKYVSWGKSHKVFYDKKYAFK